MDTSKFDQNMQEARDEQIKLNGSTAGVYRIWCKTNGRSYIGSSLTSCEGRIKSHFASLRSMSHASAQMNKDFKDFGRDNFAYEILMEFKPSDKMQDVLNAEAEFCEKFESFFADSGYNKSKVAIPAEGARRTGRPKGPDKVVFKRNVEPQLVAQLDALIKGDSKPKEAYEIRDEVKVSSTEVEGFKSQIKALLEDNDRLAKELATVEHRLQRVARLTDNEKLILWIRKYDELKKAYDLRVGGSEFSQ